MSRPTSIGPGERNHKVHVFLNELEFEALQMMMVRRRAETTAAYFRFMLECDWNGDLMVIDDAFKKICEAIGRGFGGAAAELAAKADAYDLERTRRDLGL